VQRLQDGTLLQQGVPAGVLDKHAAHAGVQAHSSSCPAAAATAIGTWLICSLSALRGL
jgi:hypothetical protein